MDKKESILDEVDDLVSKLVYYDRKEDEDLERGDIEKAIDSGHITIDDITNKFSEIINKWNNNRK